MEQPDASATSVAPITYWFIEGHLLLVLLIQRYDAPSALALINKPAKQHLPGNVAADSP
ncbi:MAG TPA: hypothetical protein VJ603_02815 [Paucimonas sp.]|nr:hypothetical protein [Paucimonas sp.]